MADTEVPNNVADSLKNSIRLTENEYNDAMARGDSAAAQAARDRSALLYAQGATLSGNQALLKEMMAVSPKVLSKVVEEMNAGGIDAFKKMLDSQKLANDKKQEMYMDEVNRMYNSRLATAEGPARLLASFKGFALLLQAFGFDCADFIKECDQKIEAEYAKVPKKDIEGISKINAYTVDPTQPAKAMDIMRRTAQDLAKELPDSIDQASQDAMRGATLTITGGRNTAAPQAPSTQESEPVETGLVVSAMEKIIAEKKLITADKSAGLKTALESGLTAAAGVDRNSKSISEQDIDAVAINTQGVIKSHGGKMSADDAMKLAKDAIERARSMAIAGAPNPQPG